MRFFNKLNISLAAIILGCVYVGIQLYKISNICNVGGVYYVDCSDFFFHTKFIALYFSFLLAPVVLTLPFKRAVFETWKKFAVWAIPVLGACSLFVIFADTGGGLGGALGQQLLSVVLLGLFGIYLLVSLVVMAVGFFKKN